MSTDIARLLGNTLMSAVTQPAAAPRRAKQHAAGPWRRLATALFDAPRRLLARIERRRAERDALIRYATSEGRHLEIGRAPLDRALLLAGRVDPLFPFIRPFIRRPEGSRRP